MSFENITKLLEKYGYEGLFFIAFVYILITILQRRWLSNILSYISKFLIDGLTKKSNDVLIISESDIVNHELFDYIDFWRGTKIPTIGFSTSYRTLVFRKYLDIYMKQYKKSVYEYIINGDYKNMDNNTLSNSLLNLINRTVKEYESQSLKEGIPEIVIEKMKIRNNEIIDLKIELIRSVCNSNFYSSDNNYLKIYSIMNILLSILENIVSSSEVVCNSINGKLSGLEFNGETEP